MEGAEAEEAAKKPEGFRNQSFCKVEWAEMCVNLVLTTQVSPPITILYFAESSSKFNVMCFFSGFWLIHCLDPFKKTKTIQQPLVIVFCQVKSQSIKEK